MKLFRSAMTTAFVAGIFCSSGNLATAETAQEIMKSRLGSSQVAARAKDPGDKGGGHSRPK